MKYPEFKPGFGWGLCVSCNKWEKTMAFPWEGMPLSCCEWAYLDLVENTDKFPEDFKEWSEKVYPALKRLSRQKPRWLT